MPNTSVAAHIQSALDADADEFRYMAPEIQWPETYNLDEILITRESDVYELAMVVYEVGSLVI